MTDWPNEFWWRSLHAAQVRARPLTEAMLKQMVDDVRALRPEPKPSVIVSLALAPAVEAWLSREREFTQ